MATTIARYTKSLDLIALAIKEQRKGNQVNAARLFAAAAKHPTASYAVSVIEATNKASGKVAAAKKVKASKKVKAEADEFEVEETDEGTQAVLDNLDDDFDSEEIESEADEDEDEELDDEEGSEFDEELDADEDDISDIVEGRSKARAFAAALKQMRRRK